MNHPKVSVIIPNYNHAEYLQQRIECVLDQTYTNLEVIILDDCSTDSSRDIINRYRRHPRIVHIEFNHKNSGSPFKQWKKGIDIAIGEWIWIAESDDYSDLFFLETMIQSLLLSPEAGMIYCDSKIVSKGVVWEETFATIKNRKFKTNRWNNDYFNIGKDEIENYLLVESTINNTSAVLFNRAILISINPFDLDLKYIGDKYVFIRVLAKSSIKYLSKSLNYYRDPFSNKHKDRHLYYFYEQFLVLNWVFMNLKEIAKDRFFAVFYQNTNLSLYTHWSKEKWIILRKLFVKNRELLFRCILFNLRRPFLRNHSE